MDENRKMAGALALAVKEVIEAVKNGQTLKLGANPIQNAQECLDWFESVHGEVKLS